VLNANKFPVKGTEHNFFSVVTDVHEHTWYMKEVSRRGWTHFISE